MVTRMQEKQDMHTLPPVGWLAYCRLVQAARPAQAGKDKRQEEWKDDHANAN